MKKFKKLLSVLLAAAIMISTLCVGTVSAGATSSYNPDAACSYAKKNAYNGIGKCAEFVSNCIEAGGIKNAWDASCSQLVKELKKSGTGELLKLKIYSNGYIPYSSNKDKLSKGDVIFYYCASETDGKPYVHTALFSGETSNDAIKVYAHNGAKNNETLAYKKCAYCGSTKISAYSFHFNGSSSYYTVGETRKVTTKSGLTIRSGIGTGCSKVGVIPYGKEFTVTTYPISKNGYQWCYTETQWGSGYVVYDKYSSYVSGDIFPQGSFKLSPKCAPDSSITVAGKSYANETILHLWENHTDGSCGCMTWYFEPVSYNNRTGEIYYAIRNQRSGLAIDINIYNSGVQQYEPHYGDNQLFKLVPVGDGYYRIESMYGYSLDIQSGYSDNGTLVILWYNDDYDAAQLFRLYE